MNDLYATLKTRAIPLKYEEVHEVYVEENDKENALKPLNEIVIDYQKMDSSKMDRNSILEQLRKKKVLVTICETEDERKRSILPKLNAEELSEDKTQDDGIKENEVIARKEKESITLDDEDDDEDGDGSKFSRKEIEEESRAFDKNKSDQEPQPEIQPVYEKVPLPKEDMNPDGLPLKAPESKTVFIICSTSKVAPGKAAKETIDKGNNEDYKELAKIPDWRNRLCNTFASPLDLDKHTWDNVHHYMIYSKYKNHPSEELQTALRTYKTAQDIEKKGTFKLKNEKGKMVKTPIAIDDDFEKNEFKYMYHALYAKITNDPELMRILYLTAPAQLKVRHGKETIEEFIELMVLRDQLMAHLQGEYHASSKQEIVPVQKEKRKINQLMQPEYLASAFDMKKLSDRLPKREKIFMKQNAYYMHNRAKYHLELKKLFKKHEDARRNGDKYSDNSELLVHQRVVFDYLNLYTPYRGLLIYHGLGSGKTFTSVAIAEGMKTNKHVVVMLPASLHYNYVTELEKFGDPLYRVDQYWEFVKTEGKEELVSAFAKALSLSTDYVRDMGGAYMVDVSKPSNYDSLNSMEQENIRKQIIKMIEQKYSFLHYNAGQSFINRMTEMATRNKQTNPFDHSVVIIDEAHNLISNIKNNLKKKKSPTNDLYELLMTAQDVRIVLLSGTPVVNHPFEMAIVYNILRGKINTWELDIEPSQKKIDSRTIEKILDQNNLHHYDLIDFKSSTRKLSITKNPFGFVNVTNKKEAKNKNQKGGFTIPSRNKTSRASTNPISKKTKRTTRKKMTEISQHENEPIIESITSQQEGFHGGSMENYQGVKLNEQDVLTEKEFIVQVKKRLSENGIEIKNKIMRPKGYLALPNDEKDFQSKFVKQFNDGKNTGDILNRDTLHRRIMGLTSYFRSPKEGLLPDFVLTDSGDEYHNVFVEMSDVQFEAYAALRSEERDRETKERKRERMARAKAQGQNNHEILQSSGSYRSATRLVCNYAIPSDPGRPRAVDIEVQDIEQDVDGEDGAAQMRKEKKKIYDKEIERVANLLRERKDEFFSDKSLENNSPKFLEMIKRIMDEKHKGPHLLYSDFLNMEGIEFFKMVLEQNNMRELKVEKYGKDGWRLKDFDTPENAGKLCYITYTGEGDPEERDLLRNIYNSEWTFVPDEISNRLQEIATTNKEGNIVKIIMITRAGAEGINLKNTRYVHIMEPYWHKTRIDQVVGRARRIGSHVDLEPELRTVQVFQYLSVFSEKQKKSEQYKEIMINDISKIDGKSPVSTDQYLYELSLLKQKLNDQFLRVIKESAVDCRLYRSGHTKKEPLVCYGDTRNDSNEFTSYPSIQIDLENQPV